MTFRTCSKSVYLTSLRASKIAQDESAAEDAAKKKREMASWFTALLSHSVSDRSGFVMNQSPLFSRRHLTTQISRFHTITDRTSEKWLTRLMHKTKFEWSARHNPFPSRQKVHSNDRLEDRGFPSTLSADHADSRQVDVLLQTNIAKLILQDVRCCQERRREKTLTKR